MTWMNEGEIDQTADLLRHRRPDLYPYARFLSDWRDTVNDNSDGWPYWRAGYKPAGKLMALLEQARQAAMGFGTAYPNPAALNRALGPIRAAATRHNLPKPTLAPTA